MPVDTPDHAALVGYCPGTLELPTDAGRCATCGHKAGLTAGGYVGHHVEEPSPRPITVDEDDSLTTVDAVNTLVHGLLLGKPTGAEEDVWQVFHAGTGLILHRPNYFFPRGLAGALVCQLGTLTDWLGEADSIRDDKDLALGTQMMCFMAYRGMEDPMDLRRL